jgi:hypothetical protein
VGRNVFLFRPLGCIIEMQSGDNQADTGNVELTTTSTDGESSDREEENNSPEEYNW